MHSLAKDDDAFSEGNAEGETLLDNLEKDLPHIRKDARIYDEEEQDISVQLVQKVVPSGDDPTLPTLTIRVFVIGILLCCVGAGVSQLFYFKSNAPSFSSFFTILISLPMGNLMANYLPAKTIRVFNLDIDLNPGPYNIKEHLLTVIIAISGASAAYAGMSSCHFILVHFMGTINRGYISCSGSLLQAGHRCSRRTFTASSLLFARVAL